MEIRNGTLTNIAKDDIIDGNLIIPDGVKRIENNVGINLKNLEKLFFSDSVIEIGQNAFSKCESLKKIVFSNNVKTIDKSAFSNCITISKINLPKQLEIIEEGVFQDCNNLKELIIPKSVKKFAIDYTKENKYNSLLGIVFESSLNIPFNDLLEIVCYLGIPTYVHDRMLIESQQVISRQEIQNELTLIIKEECLEIISNKLAELDIIYDPIDLFELIHSINYDKSYQEQIENIVNYISAKYGKSGNYNFNIIPANDFFSCFFGNFFNENDAETNFNVAYDNSRQERFFDDVLHGKNSLFREFNKEINNPNLNKIHDEILLANGSILNYKNYQSSPTMGRDKEVENLEIILLQDKKSPILVGESGVGKTAIVDELVYRIQKNDIPSFLKNQLIYELSINSALANTKYRGELEEKIKKILECCIEKNIILFIDEIHTIFGAGRTESSCTDVASIIKFYIDRYNLKIIGTTTKEEYNLYVANDALKRRFERININEPDYTCLHQIIEKVINDYTTKNNISMDEINNNLSSLIDFLIDATQNKHRVYDDKINNPDLVISIIDKAFAYAKFEDNLVIKIDHFIKAINSCDRIYDSRKEKIISSLENFSNEKQKTYTKCIKFEPLKQ